MVHSLGPTIFKLWQQDYGHYVSSDQKKGMFSHIDREKQKTAKWLLPEQFSIGTC